MGRRYAIAGILAGLFVGFASAIDPSATRNAALAVFVGMLVMPVVLIFLVWRYPDRDAVMGGCFFCGIGFGVGFEVIPVAVTFLFWWSHQTTTLVDFVLYLASRVSLGLVFGCMLGIYHMIVGRIAYAIIRRVRRVTEKHERVPPICFHCGYSLLNLTERRCPECGHHFDARDFEWPDVTTRATAGVVESAGRRP